MRTEVMLPNLTVKVAGDLINGWDLIWFDLNDDFGGGVVVVMREEWEECNTCRLELFVLESFFLPEVVFVWAGCGTSGNTWGACVWWSGGLEVGKLVWMNDLGLLWELERVDY